MVYNLKENHRYIFYKQRPGTDDIIKFSAVLIDIRGKTLLVHSYEGNEPLFYKCSKQCILSMPIDWIKKVEPVDENDIVNSEDIIIHCLGYKILEN